MEKIEKASKNKGTVTGIPTGFLDLDYKLSGLQPSDLILVAARPSMGKTAFVLNIAQHVAFKSDRYVAVFSLEMSKEQLVNRLFSLESQVDSQSLRTGNLKDADWEKFCNRNTWCVIDDQMRLTDDSGTLDQLLPIGIFQITRSEALRELNVPVIALSQLSRAVEQRPDHRPMLSDLRESGAIEQDADVVMFIYRDEYYNKDSEYKKQAEIIIAKQRNGPVGTVHLAWLGEYIKFANLSRQE